MVERGLVLSDEQKRRSPFEFFPAPKLELPPMAIPPVPAPISLIPPPNPEVIGALIQIPPLPSLDELLRNIPPPRPVPPLTPTEKRMREIITSPEFARDFIITLHFSPQTATTMLNFLLRNYPRAFPGIDIAYQREWEEAEQERYRQQQEFVLRQYDALYRRWLSEKEGVIERTQADLNTALRAIQMSNDVSAVLDVLHTYAPRLQPHQYELLKLSALSQIGSILMDKPKDEAMRYLDALEKSGWISRVQRLSMEHDVTLGQLMRDINSAVVDIVMTRINYIKDMAKKVGEMGMVTELDRVSNKLEALRNAIAQVGGDPKALNQLTQVATGFANNLEQNVRRIYQSAVNLTQRFVTTVDRFIRELPRTRAQNLPQLYGNIINNLPPILRAPVAEAMQAREQDELRGKLNILNAFKKQAAYLLDIFKDLSVDETGGNLVDQLIISDLQRIYTELDNAVKQYTEQLNWRTQQDKAINQALDAVKNLPSAVEVRYARLLESVRARKLRERIAASLEKYRNETSMLRRFGLALGILRLLHDLDEELATQGMPSQARQKLLSTFRSLANLKVSLTRLMSDLEFQYLLPPQQQAEIKELSQVVERQLDEITKQLNKGSAPSSQSINRILLNSLQLHYLLSQLGVPLLDEDILMSYFPELFFEQTTPTPTPSQQRQQPRQQPQQRQQQSTPTLQPRRKQTSTKPQTGRFAPQFGL